MHINLYSLQVINNEGAPIPNARIEMLSSSGAVMHKETTDATGFAVLKLKKTTVQIRISQVAYCSKEVKVKNIEDGPIELTYKEA